jgi:nitroimidazol reductase NimA-like FMN-containing flavoprotein (pyridoxamine 5'-phosphate oxidase superfamily)
MEPIKPTTRTQVSRHRERGAYDRPLIYSVLDEALICHVGFVVDGQPVVIPTIHARIGDRLYMHGAVANRMLKTLRTGVQACVTVTVVDGLVLARSAFHHSMNYRSVVIFGTATETTDLEEKRRAFEAIVEHVCAGRSKDVRAPDDNETKATLVMSLPIVEASAKVRSGPPIDAERDYSRDCWAGVVPLKIQPQAPISDERLAAGTPVPRYITEYPGPNPKDSA